MQCCIKYHCRDVYALKMKLFDLVFSDLFVTGQNATSWYKSTSDSLDCVEFPVECFDDLAELRGLLNTKNNASSDFKVDFQGLRLRIKRIETENQGLFHVRRYRLMPAGLAKLGVPQSVCKYLLDENLKDGLVLFMGKSGSGKTTTAASFIDERIRAFGGVCFTVENPIEIPMEGECGRGRIYQTEVVCDSEIGGAVQDLMRVTPNIIFIGELRDMSAVREAIIAANSGHLVVATLHAPGLLSGIEQLVRKANDDATESLVSEVLRVAIHLELKNNTARLDNRDAIFEPNSEGTGTPARILRMSPIWIGGTGVEGLKSMIRKGEIQALKSEVERQRRALMSNKPLFEPREGQ